MPVTRSFALGICKNWYVTSPYDHITFNLRGQKGQFNSILGIEGQKFAHASRAIFSHIDIYIQAPLPLNFTRPRCIIVQLKAIKK